MSSDRPPVTREDRGSVAVLTIENPPVNALSSAVLTAAGRLLDEALADPATKAVVVTGANGTFIGGADITRLERIARGEAPEVTHPTLPELIAALETATKPVVAAIDGFALGGGLELALGCAARVATPRARMGLPELRLGLIPGAGGTVRLPRLIGVGPAVDAMLRSTQIDGATALDLDLIAALAEPDALVDRAASLALELAAAGTWPRTLERGDKLPLPDALDAVIDPARALAKKRYRDQDFANACIEAVVFGVRQGPEAGLIHERDLFQELLQSDTARALIHVFFAERAVTKVPGVTDQGQTPVTVDRVGVLGGGTMGSGIATALAIAGYDVTLVESSPDLAAKAGARVKAHLAGMVDRARLSTEAAAGAQDRVAASAELESLAACPMVIEAVPEDRELKRRLLGELSSKLGADAVLATNTSTIELSQLTDAVQDPARLLGLHFFSPAHVMKLVEVVRHDQTSTPALLTALSVCKKIGKTPVTVRSAPGFLVNRMFMPYSQATGFLIDRGVDPYRIDRALVAFGMPMGPCRMSDLAGIDVGVLAGAELDRAYGARAYRSRLRELLAEEGRLGEKSGLGHYRYVDGKAVEDPHLAGFLARARAFAGNPEPLDVSDEAIVHMTLFGVVNEACRCLAEGVALRPDDIDVAAILGYGFPRHRGGPMHWASTLGFARVADALEEWHQRYGAALFEPSDALRGHAS